MLHTTERQHVIIIVGEPDDRKRSSSGSAVSVMGTGGGGEGSGSAAGNAGHKRVLCINNRSTVVFLAR